MKGRYEMVKRDHVLKGDIELHFIRTQYQLVDIFTKPLDELTFKRLIVELVNRRLFTVLEEPVTLDKPESSNPFLPASQVDFTFDEITFTTNNEVALLGIRGDIGITTFRNALRAKYLPHSSMYVPSPSITIVRPWFATIGYRGEIKAKGTLKKSCLPPRWRLLMAQIMQCLGGKTDGLDQISNNDATILEKIVPYPRFLSLLLEHMIPEYENEELTINPTQVVSVHNLTLKPYQLEEPPFTDHIKAIYNLDVHVDSKAPKPSSQTEEVPQGKKPRAKGSNPNVLVDKTKFASDGLKIAHTDSGANEESRADDISLKSQKEELEQAKVTAEAEVALMKDKPSYPDINQPTELLVTSLKPELSKLLALHDFVSFLPTELKELPSKITGLSGEIKELKKHVKDMEIELSGDLKEIPTKLETFTSTISIQEKLKILDSLPSLLHKVTDTLNGFATMVENASGAKSMNVPSAGKATASPTEGEKNTKDVDTNLKDELVDLLGKNVVTQYYTNKLLFDKYYDKMLKRKKSPKITKCEVLTKKGPITLKMFRNFV
ncbi:hypothetical protein Tco_0109366 [Tanacetum coccineum]